MAERHDIAMAARQRTVEQLEDRIERLLSQLSQQQTDAGAREETIRGEWRLDVAAAQAETLQAVGAAQQEGARQLEQLQNQLERARRESDLALNSLRLDLEREVRTLKDSLRTRGVELEAALQREEELTSALTEEQQVVVELQDKLAHSLDSSKQCAEALQAAKASSKEKCEGLAASLEATEARAEISASEASGLARAFQDYRDKSTSDAATLNGRNLELTARISQLQRVEFGLREQVTHFLSLPFVFAGYLYMGWHTSLFTFLRCQL